MVDTGDSFKGTIGNCSKSINFYSIKSFVFCLLTNKIPFCWDPWNSINAGKPFCWSTRNVAIMVPIWSPPCQPYHTLQRYTIATQKPICAPYHTRACSPQCHPYRTSAHPNYQTLCRIVYNFKPGPPSPSHQIGSMSHLLWRRRVTSSAICFQKHTLQTSRPLSSVCHTSPPFKLVLRQRQ